VFRIDFLPGGTAHQFLQDGWSFQEPIGIWAVGAQSSLHLPPARTSGASHLLIKLSPRVLSPKALRQRLELTLNGQVIHSEVLQSDATRIACAIPEGLLHTEVNNSLVISHPDAVAPRDVSSTNTDPRRLAVCVRYLELEYQVASQETPAPDELPAQQLGDARERPLVLCFGNAICREIVLLLRSFPPFDAAFELRLVKDVNSFAVALNSLSNKDRSRLAAAWEQISNAHVDDKAIPKSSGLPANVHIRFPALALNSLWPLQGDDPRLVAEPLYPCGRYPYTDIAGVRLSGDSAEMNDEDLYATYRTLSRSLMPDLPEKRKLDESKWHELDSCCDIKLTEFITANLRHQRLFYSPEMPCAPIIINIAEHLIGSVLPDMRLQNSTLRRDFHRYVRGYRGMFYDEAPIHPDVLEAFNVPGVTTTYEYRREHNKRTFREHIIDYIRWAPWFAGGRAHGE
jgi:hypothetical protein